MSDGAVLAAHHYRAPGASPAPAVLLMTPYRKETAVVSELTKRAQVDLHAICADVRGVGGSSGRYNGIYSPREIEDGVELIAWIAAQPWCDGSVGLIGGSYCGGNQLLIAARRPPALRCISPVMAPVDTYRGWTRRGGIPSITNWGAMTYPRAQRRATLRDGLAHYSALLAGETDTADQKVRSSVYVLDRIDVPTLLIGGWHDFFVDGTLRSYWGIPAPSRLVIGPWSHGDPGQVYAEELGSWLRYWLLRDGEDPLAKGTASLYVTGLEEWTEREAFRRPEEIKGWMHLYPHPGGGLGDDAANSAIEIQTVLDLGLVPPAPNPRPGSSPDVLGVGIGAWGEQAAFDSAALANDTLLEGPVCASVVLSATCSDIDLYCRCSVVAADGSAAHLSEGRLRASHRKLDASRSMVSPDGVPVLPWHVHDSVSPLAPGEEVEMVVEMGPVAHLWRAGERLRVGFSAVRSDEDAAPATLRLLPGTRVLLPLRDG